MNTPLEIRLYDTLKRIARDYEKPERLRRRAERDWGVSGEEALEMAYENIQQEAENAIKGLRIRRPKPEAGA